MCLFWPPFFLEKGEQDIILKNVHKEYNMAEQEMKQVKGGVTAAKGFVANAISCGIKKPTATRLDLALVYSELPTTSAGTFTTNRVRAACVRVSQSHLRHGNIRAVVANSGNANACTGAAGVAVARKE